MEKRFNKKFKDIDLYSHLGTKCEKETVKQFIKQELDRQKEEIKIDAINWFEENFSWGKDLGSPVTITESKFKTFIKTL